MSIEETTSVIDRGPQAAGHRAPRSRAGDRRPWDRVRAWLGSHVALGLVVVVAIQVVTDVFLLRRSFFFAEDFTTLQVYDDLPLGRELLTQSLFGHLVPGFVLVHKYFAAVFGASWAAASVLTVLVHLGGTIAFARLVAALRGWTWWVPWLTAAFTLGVVTLNTVPWWAATWTMQATTIAAVSTWGCALRYDRTGRVRHLVSVLVMFTISVAFFEKSIGTCVYLGLFVLMVPVLGRDRLGDRWRAALRLWPVWAILATVSLVDLYFYFTGGYLDQAGASPGVGDTTTYLARSLPEGVLPSLLGAIYPDSTLPGPDVLTPVVATAVALALVVATSWRSATARRAWCWFAVSALVSQSLVARGRLGVADADAVVFNLRYQVDTAYLFLVAIAVAVPAACRTCGPTVRRRLTVAAALAPVLVAPLWLQSVSTIEDLNPGRASRAYFADLVAGRVPDGAALLDLPVPEAIVPAPMYPWNTLDRIAPLLRPGTSVTTDRRRGAVLIRSDGSIGPVRLRTLSPPSQGSVCAAPGAPPAPVLATGALPDPGPGLPLLVDMVVDAGSGPGAVSLSVDGPDGPADARGTGELITVGEGTRTITVAVRDTGWTSLSLAASPDATAPVCVSAVRLATLR